MDRPCFCPCLLCFTISPCSLYLAAPHTFLSFHGIVSSSLLSVDQIKRPLTPIVKNVSVTFIFTRFGFDGVSFLSSSLCVFWPVVCMQGMTTHFKTSKALKVSEVKLVRRFTQMFGSPLIRRSCPADQERSGRECPRAQRR